MFQEYQEFFDVLWHTDDSGNKISIQRLNEQHKIVNNKIILMEIPDSFYKVTISNKYEININSEILSQNYFKVSYLTGEVYFHSSLEGQIITIAQYFGRGLIKTMAKRVELSNENNLYNASNVEDFATDITNRVNNIINNAGDSNIEIIDARDNSSTETVYTTLKDRLDSEYNNNIESLALKANQSALDTTNSALALKADQTDLNTTNSIVSLKADKTYVDTQITSMVSGTPNGVYATLELLTAAHGTDDGEIYVVAADGHIYDWVGSGWADTGIQYQSTGIADASIFRKSLNIELQKDQFEQRKLGIDPVYNTSNPWIVTGATGTSTAVWQANAGNFAEGDKFLEINRGNTEVIVSQNIPIDVDLLGKINRKIRLLITYSSNVASNFYMYQRTSALAACVPNTAITRSLSNTGGAEKTEEFIGNILWDAAYVVPYLKANLTGVIKIASIKISVIGENQTSVLSGILGSVALNTKDLATQVHFGNDPAYETVNPYLRTPTGTSTYEWLDNTTEFTFGSKYAKFFVGDTSIIGTFLSFTLPMQFQKKLGRNVRIKFTYKSDVVAVVRIYQRSVINGAWCNPNTYYTLNLPVTIVEKTVEITIPILWDSVQLSLYAMFTLAGTIKIGSVRLSVIGNDIVSTVAEDGVIYQTIVVDALGTGDFASIKAAIDSIIDASDTNRYKIFIKNGTYNEVNVDQKKHYIDLIAESRDVILRSDGTVAPWDIVELFDKHGLWLTATSTVENMTIDVNDVKYCVHSDGSPLGGETAYEAVFKNCSFKHATRFPIGAGVRAGQNITFEDCEFEIVEPEIESDSENKYGVNWHTWNNQNDRAILTIKRCKFINCGILRHKDLGSDQDDIIHIEHCTTNLDDVGIWLGVNATFYLPEGETVPPIDPALVPYCSRLNLVGDVPFIEMAENRPDRNNYHALGHYDTVVLNNTVSTITKGTGVAADYTGADLKKSVKLPSLAGKIYGVALEDIAASSNGWIAMSGKTVFAMLKPNTYAKGALLKVDTQGLFEKTIMESEAVGVCLVATTLASNGLVKVKLF